MINLDMNKDEFQVFRDYIYAVSGINYTENKKIILQNRIRRRLRELNLTSYMEYFKLIKDKPITHEEVVKFFDEVTTNETSFFRHERQFIALQNMIVPDILKLKSSRELSVWSAAASTGKEAYTIAMVLKSMPSLSSHRLSILGTDLNQQVLNIAANGEYDIKDFKDVPEEYKRYIEFDKDKGIAKIKRELRDIINLKRFNLKDSFSSVPKMDIIFCRNVFIYFEKHTQKEIMAKFYERLIPGGYFVLGHSETLHGVTDDFEYVKFNNENLMIYRKPLK